MSLAVKVLRIMVNTKNVNKVKETKVSFVPCK